MKKNGEEIRGRISLGGLNIIVVRKLKLFFSVSGFDCNVEDDDEDEREGKSSAFEKRGILAEKINK